MNTNKLDYNYTKGKVISDISKSFGIYLYHLNASYTEFLLYFYLKVVQSVKHSRILKRKISPSHIYLNKASK